MLFLYNLHEFRSGSRPSRTFLTLKFFPEHTKTSPTRANSAAAWGNFRLVANRVLKVMKWTLKGSLPKDPRAMRTCDVVNWRQLSLMIRNGIIIKYIRVPQFCFTIQRDLVKLVQAWRTFKSNILQSVKRRTNMKKKPFSTIDTWFTSPENSIEWYSFEHRLKGYCTVIM